MKFIIVAEQSGVLILDPAQIIADGLIMSMQIIKNKIIIDNFFIFYKIKLQEVTEIDIEVIYWNMRMRTISITSIIIPSIISLVILILISVHISSLI